MKKLFLGLMLSVFSLAASFAQVDDYSDYTNYSDNDYSDHTGYDGDFFSLEGALELFKQSHSIEDFERRLNREDTYVNNLDLNQDGRIDYIRVEHRRQGKYHAIILQVPINRRNVQDIAVIELEKTGRRRAMLQIVGDADIYGEDVIVEPYEGMAYSSGRGGPNADFSFRRGYVNVYYWPAVRHMFRRGYSVYASPYYWDYYPTYWRPWRPCGWNVFRPRIVIYQRHFHVVYVHRLTRVRNFYRPFRATCPSVYQRTTVVRKSGRRSFYSKANQNRVRSNKNIGRAKTKGKKGRLNSTRGAKTNTRVEKNTRVTKQRLERSKTRQSAPKVDYSERGTRKKENTQRYTPKVNKQKKRTSKTNRSTKTTTKKSRSTTSRKKSTRSSTPTKRNSTTKRSTPSRKKTTRTTKTKTSKKTTPRKSTSKKRTTKSRKRN